MEHDIEELEEHDVQPHVIVRHGWVVDEIADEARQGDYGLVVIGAHRTEGWRRFLLDDLARQIILQCDRPVLVVKQLLGWFFLFGGDAPGEILSGQRYTFCIVT